MWEGSPPGGSGPRSDRLIDHCDESPRNPGTQLPCAQQKLPPSRRREGGGREGVVLRVWVWLCVFARVRACVHACVYCEKACSPMEAGPGAEKLQLQRPPRQLQGLTGPGRGWRQHGGQMARPRPTAPLSVHPLGLPPRLWGTNSWPSSSSSCRCNSCSNSTCSTYRGRGWSACSLAKPQGPSRPSRKVSNAPPPAPTPAAFTKPWVRPGLCLCSQPASLSLLQQRCARQTCLSCGKARVPQGSLLRTASGRRGWTWPAQLPLLPRLPAPPRSPHLSPTTPYPTDSPLCSHLGETGMDDPRA